MTRKIVMIVIAVTGILGPTLCVAAEEIGGLKPALYVADSAISARIASRFAAESHGGLSQVHVDADANGAVLLTGWAPTKAAAARALAIALDTEDVATVHSEIKVASAR